MTPLDRAQGRWREILSSHGLDDQFMRNRHGPCPLCGGKDRFRFDDKNGLGTYFCGQCGAGTGYTLLRKLKGYTDRDALQAIEEIVGKDAQPLPPTPAKPRYSARSLAEFLEEARSPHALKAYLQRRRITETSPVLRGHGSCPYYEPDPKRPGKYRLVGNFAAVLAPIVDPAGNLIGIQRVYDADVPERKKVLGNLKGGVVRLQEPTDELAICEGWETGLAAWQIYRIPVWACLTAGNLMEFRPPPGILRLHVYGDNDESCVGQAAAYAVAVRINRWSKQHKTGLEPVMVHLPPDLGSDWLDAMVEGRLN